MTRISALQRVCRPYRKHTHASQLSSHELKDVGLAKHELGTKSGWHIDLLFTSPQDFN